MAGTLLRADDPSDEDAEKDARGADDQRVFRHGRSAIITGAADHANRAEAVADHPEYADSEAANYTAQART